MSNQIIAEIYIHRPLVWRRLEAEFMSDFYCLRSFGLHIRHYADMRITLDLDDGVKVNYGKFGDLLAEVKAITGGASDD